MNYIPKEKAKQQDIERKLASANAIIASNGLTNFDETQDLTDFNSACALFRATCNDLGTLLGIDDFHGGYDELLAIVGKAEMRTEQGTILSDKLNLANSLCLHEAKKVGLPAPDWFFKCWDLEV